MRMKQLDIAISASALFDAWHSVSDPEDDTDFSIAPDGSVRWSGDPDLLSSWAGWACWETVLRAIERMREDFLG